MMKSYLYLRSALEDQESIRDLEEVFSYLMGVRRMPGGVENDVASGLPQWLLGRFSKELSRDEKLAWLQRWRAASGAEKIRLEKRRGWEIDQFLYWFSAGNDAWSIEGVEIQPSGRRLVLTVSHADEPFPISAIEWISEAGGAYVEGVERRE